MIQEVVIYYLPRSIFVVRTQHQIDRGSVGVPDTKQLGLEIRDRDDAGSSFLSGTYWPSRTMRGGAVQS